MYLMCIVQRFEPQGRHFNDILPSVIWFHFTIYSLVLLPNPITLFVLSLFCLMVHSLELFSRKFCLAARRRKLVGGKCSMLPYGICIYCYALLSTPFFIYRYTFKNLVLINRRNDPRYQRVLALCTFFFKQGQYRWNWFFETKLLDVCVCFLYICVWTDFVVFWIICGLMTCALGKKKKRRQIEHCF